MRANQVLMKKNVICEVQSEYAQKVHSNLAYILSYPSFFADYLFHPGGFGFKQLPDRIKFGLKYRFDTSLG
jgi:hypothetical protein